MPRRPPTDAHAELTQRLADVERRLAALEQSTQTPHPQSRASSALDAAPEGALLAFLTERAARARRSAHGRGALLIGGIVTAAESRYVALHLLDVADALADPARVADALAAIASAPRIALLRRLLRGDASRSELLAEMAGESSGQLYHHLNALLATGLVGQARRGHYKIVPDRVVPVLALLGAANLLASGGLHEEPLPAT